MRALSRETTTAALLPFFLLATSCSTTTQSAMQAAAASVRTQGDPRVGLRPGLTDAGEAAWNLQLVAHVNKSDRFFNPENAGDFAFANADLAFNGNYVFQGGYNGWQVWDISAPGAPRLRTSLICPGGQGDVSVYRNLLFMSVEETRGRLDCGAQGVTDTVSTERFRGVRIFDISDIDHPRQVASVQTCRGSHTHTLVSDPRDQSVVYVYVSGTSRVRPGSELAGCSGLPPEQDPNTSLFRIEVIRVPLDAPQDARVVNMPRIFATGSNIAGLWRGGAHGEGTQQTAETNMCHDITVYTEIGLAAGACSGNGILLDIRDPASPRRVAEVSDPNFAYWHSATFSNDARKVIFTDEWGGGVSPRCRATDNPKWGADAIYTRDANNTLHPAGFFKIPAAQTETENCVAHNGSLIPVPGRDIFVQAWYQGGVSVFDFTDPAHPREIAFFDRGPISATQPQIGGYWSAYWYNGRIYGSEIIRGLDVFELRPSALLSQNEIDAAKSVHLDRLNVQDQHRIVWPASFSVARAYLDQLRRGGGLSASRLAAVSSALDRAQGLSGAEQQSALTTLATSLDADVAASRDGARVRAMAEAVRGIGR
jgi:hypothetical protein